jgi:DNA repair exonuclease SbcCD ATPase subunit
MSKEKIVIRELIITYFKGVKKLNLEFNNSETSLFGANGSYKSTIVDSFSWCLFGKNSEGKSDTSFSIKTLDENNLVIPKIDHTVEAVLLVNGDPITLKRTLKEKWQKKRGSVNSEFTGNETKYWINDVPKTQREYQDKINDILKESIFKLVTDTLAFEELHWEKKREILIGIVGSDDVLAKIEQSEEDKKRLSSQRKLLNDQIKTIPTRIDEVEQGKPESIDFFVAEAERNALCYKLLLVEEQIEDKSKALIKEGENITKIHNEITGLKRANNAIDDETFDAERKKQSVSDEIEYSIKVAEQKKDKLSQDLVGNNSSLKLANERIMFIETQLVGVRENWKEENARELIFSNDLFACPTCKTPLSEDNIESEKEKMQQDFNADKKNSIERINLKGGSLSEDKKDIEIKIQSIEKNNFGLEKDVEKLNQELAGLKSKSKIKKLNTFTVAQATEMTLDENKEYQNNLAKIKQLQEILENRPNVDNSTLKVQKTEIQNQILGLDKVLASKEIIEKSDKRISQLEIEEQDLAQQISTIEKQEYQAQELAKKQILALETEINSKFKHVKFKMFETQVNGSEIPTCKALVNGVPFSDANTASRVNYGLDIINTLSEFYEVSAPVFIDNRESVTNLIETDSQIINLIVSPNDNKIRVV